MRSSPAGQFLASLMLAGARRMPNCIDIYEGEACIRRRRRRLRRRYHLLNTTLVCPGPAGAPLSPVYSVDDLQPGGRLAG